MFKMDVYLRVRRAVMVDGMSMREAARVFGLHRDTVRQYQKEQCKMLKASGLCRDCGGSAIPGQTRCEECAEKHRVQRRKHDRDRRARLKAEQRQNV